MRITVLGGGNIGTLLAAQCAKEDHIVTLCTSTPDVYSSQMEVYDRNEKLLFSTKISRITSDLSLAIHSSDLIFITYPAEVLSDLSTTILPFLQRDQKICFIPGSGGVEFAFYDFIKTGAQIFGLQRVPAIARLKQRGQSVYMLGKKSEFKIGAIPSAVSTKFVNQLETIFDLSGYIVPNYLSVTLTPSNPIIHTVRLYSLFANYPDEFYSRQYKFYEEWDDVASSLLLQCDTELQNLCSIIPIDLKFVRSLKEHYENDTVEGMTKKISNIPAFKGILAPMKECQAGWQPDFSSRYFSSDFPYGLKILLDVGELFNVSMPVMRNLWNWYVNIHSPKHFFKLNIPRVDFLNLYNS